MKQEDIQITEIRITDTFRYGGVTFQGLEGLRRYSINGYSGKMGWRPFVVRKEQSYPCFDSSDFMYEDRSYQTYFFTMDKEVATAICEETRMSSWDYMTKHIEEKYPVLEPMFNMSKIQEYHLPFIYYHGDGDTMEIVEDRNARWKIEVLTPRPRYEYDYDPTPCLYGPPPEYRDIEDDEQSDW